MSSFETVSQMFHTICTRQVPYVAEGADGGLLMWQLYLMYYKKNFRLISA